MRHMESPEAQNNATLIGMRHMAPPDDVQTLFDQPKMQVDQIKMVVRCNLQLNMTKHFKRTFGQNNFQEQVQHDVMYDVTTCELIVIHHTNAMAIIDHCSTTSFSDVQTLWQCSVQDHVCDVNKCLPPRSPLINHFNKSVCEITRPRLNNCCLYVLKYYILPPTQKRLPTLIINK